MIHSLVLSDGTIDEQKVLKKERVYQGMNGRYVERFFINHDQSYIFKPLTNDSQIGKELWVHNHILKELPSIYPRLIAYSIDANSHWIIFEDLGVMDHRFSDESVLGVIKLMAHWHKTTPDIIEGFPQKGPKPSIEEVVEHLKIRKDDVKRLAANYHIPVSTIESLFIQLNHISFQQQKVLSHGDLHLGNFGYAKGKLFIIDWEHAHLNYPYWDLYHLLDISHPVFPKRINKNLRNTALELYIDETDHLRRPPIRNSFKQDYYLFSSAFSLWMILLIEGNLERNDVRWSKEQLKQQIEETVLSFKQCIDELFGKKDF
ncbi:phosphotransferase [Bacillus dakarensis]|uniref:phosphotransferase n=1 Tax=Robertmurraya dakarensis TaxID=1926278 RepID=UPI0009809B88|nr:phosphotransferase [Bacillus dakarensis]